MPGLVPGTHALLAAPKKDVGGRDKPGHDELGDSTLSERALEFFGYSASPLSSFGTSPTRPAASRMKSCLSPGRRSTSPRPRSRTKRKTSERLENSRLRPSVATPIAIVSNRRQR